MYDLAADSPLAGATTINRTRFQLRESPDFDLIRVQIFHRDETQLPALVEALADEPPGPGMAHQHGDQLWLWSAPGEWIVAVTAGTGSETLAALQQMTCKLFAVVTLVTDSRVVLRLDGARVRDVLARGTTVDLHPQHFCSGSCTVTRFAGVPVMLFKPAEGNDFLIFACRSLAIYLDEWFQAASRDC